MKVMVIGSRDRDRIDLVAHVVDHLAIIGVELGIRKFLTCLGDRVEARFYAASRIGLAELLDIDNTVANGVRSVAAMGVTMLTIHAYPKAMRAAVQQEFKDNYREIRALQQHNQGGVSNFRPTRSTGRSPEQRVRPVRDNNIKSLSDAERRVLLDAVEGTDICERGSDIPALQALCEGRIETRSEEFASNQSSSAEDSLLGGGLDAGRTATLQAAIARLAGAGANPGNFDNQVVASVALNNQSLSDTQATAAEGDPAAELSQETQAVVAAIVQQLGGGN